MDTIQVATKTIYLCQGILTEGKAQYRKVACFVKNENNILNIKRGRSKLVSSWRSTILSLPLQ
jgi:hypothetical protein